MNAIEAYLLARAYTNQALEGAGALKGAACQIKSITSITGGHRVTFEWEDDEGESSTETMDVMDGTNGTDGDDGVGIASITYKEMDVSGNYVYTVTLTDSNSYDITCPKGPQGSTGQTGADGNGIVSITKTGTSGLVDTYTITYTDGTTSTFTVTNGQDGDGNEFIGTTAEWNALTTAQKKEYDTYQLTDDYTDGKYAHHYSTDEQIVGTWIDGSTIYERTWDLGSDITLSAGQWVNMSQYITIPNCDKMIVSSGVSSEGVTSTLESAYNAGYLELRHMQFNGAVRYVTLQYTKTA